MCPSPARTPCLCASASGDERRYIQRVQFALRERQYPRQPLPQTKYDLFEREFRAEATDTLSFAMSVHSDLQAVKYDIERGEHSLRNFFSLLDFRRAKKKGAEGEKAALALEADFQRLLASELNHHARGRYSVTVEPHTAESKRRDVLCSRGDWRASIELTMSERWTLQDYVEALEHQLVGQYMRHRNATTGFLVIVLQTKGRTWKTSEQRRTLSFNEVVSFPEKQMPAGAFYAVAAAVGVMAKPRSAARRRSAAMERWRCCSS